MRASRNSAATVGCSDSATTIAAIAARIRKPRSVGCSERKLPHAVM